jgi:hypothetical protein
MKQATATKIIFAIDLVAGLTAVGLAVTLVINPESKIEPYLGLSAAVFVITELLRRYGSQLFMLEGKNLSASERLLHREVMRKDIEPRVFKRINQGQCYEVIIRHVNRADDYPDIETNDKNISSWFKTELIETYHSGIRVLLGIDRLVVCPDGYRYMVSGSDTGESVKGFLFGEINYDSIELINWDGDEYYNSPIIYCHFDHEGMPYQSLVYDKEVGKLHDRVIYETIVDKKTVQLNSEGVSGAGHA